MAIFRQLPPLKEQCGGALPQPARFVLRAALRAGCCGSCAAAAPSPALLAAKGSIFLTRPTLMSYNVTRAELTKSANALFKVVQSGAVKIEINQTYKLKDAAKAHRDLEGRKTTGSTIFTV